MSPTGRDFHLDANRQTQCSDLKIINYHMVANLDPQSWTDPGCRSGAPPGGLKGATLFQKAKGPDDLTEATTPAGNPQPI